MSTPPLSQSIPSAPPGSKENSPRTPENSSPRSPSLSISIPTSPRTPSAEGSPHKVSKLSIPSLSSPKRLFERLMGSPRSGSLSPHSRQSTSELENEVRHPTNNLSDQYFRNKMLFYIQEKCQEIFESLPDIQQLDEPHLQQKVEEIVDRLLNLYLAEVLFPEIELLLNKEKECDKTTDNFRYILDGARLVVEVKESCMFRVQSLASYLEFDIPLEFQDSLIACVGGQGMLQHLKDFCVANDSPIQRNGDLFTVGNCQVGYKTFKLKIAGVETCQDLDNVKIEPIAEIVFNVLKSSKIPYKSLANTKIGNFPEVASQLNRGPKGNHFLANSEGILTDQACGETVLLINVEQLPALEAHFEEIRRVMGEAMEMLTIHWESVTDPTMMPEPSKNKAFATDFVKSSWEKHRQEKIELQSSLAIHLGKLV